MPAGREEEPRGAWGGLAAMLWRPAPIVVILILAATASGLIVNPIRSEAALLDRSRLQLAFEETFGAPPSFWDARRNPHGRWKTNYYFGIQATDDPKGWESRTLVPNGEMEYYGDPALAMSPFEWSRGELTIVGRDNPFAADPITNHLPYLSGLITTEKSFAQATGYFEARIALPPGKGLWPAFWLLPVPRSENGYQVAPGTQEIDIFESIGQPGKLYFTNFPDLPGNQKVGDQMALQTDEDLSRFHIYGLLLTHDEIVWYLDDHEVRRVPNRDFHLPAYMLLNLAVGGTWPGVPDQTTAFPARMRIDWVRAYRLKDAAHG